MWQAEADTKLTLSALPATVVGQILLTLAKFCYSTVLKLLRRFIHQMTMLNKQQIFTPANKTTKTRSYKSLVDTKSDIQLIN